MEEPWHRLREGCERAWEGRGLRSNRDWKAFSLRLDGEFPRLASLLWDLYGSRPDFAFQVEALVAEAFAAYVARGPGLRQRDEERPPESAWFLDRGLVGAVAYVDRFAGNFRGLEARIPYLQELGVGYLHLMPFFRSPPGQSDGGYAVSSYRDTDPALGTMDDLEHLAAVLDREGLALVADFVFNHTAHDHPWALKAKAGDPVFQDYYWTFDTLEETRAYSPWLRDIFPEVRQGSFTHDAAMNRWVWTTFNSFQWDLNYRNPEVFTAMCDEMLALANRGIAVLRLDAVAFVWKEAGTNCENLPQAHTLIQAFQSMARLVCPSLLFKSEAIVHPDDIEKYIDLRECQLSYNPLLMAELWEAAATKETRLLAHSLRKRHRLPQGCSWVNYVRCHDDIGWTFADEDAAELGIKGGDHRDFLNRFYLGDFPGSFSRGLSFQHNPATSDRRICGSAASLAGIERALEQGSGCDLNTAVKRLVLLHGLAFLAGGIPLIYLGDEVATPNDYSYRSHPDLAPDTRWVHRPLWSEARGERRKVEGTVEHRVFTALAQFSRLIKEHRVLATSDLTVLDADHPSVLALRKLAGGAEALVLASFSEAPTSLSTHTMDRLLGGAPGRDLLTDRPVRPGASLDLGPCDLVVILLESQTRTYHES